MTDPTVLDVAAGRMMMIRRGNPAMGGPTPTDYVQASELLEHLGIDPHMPKAELQRRLKDRE